MPYLRSVLFLLLIGALLLGCQSQPVELPDIESQPARNDSDRDVRDDDTPSADGLS